MSDGNEKLLATEQRRSERERSALLSRLATAASLLALCYVAYFCLLNEAGIRTMARNVGPLKATGTFNWGCPPEGPENSFHDDLWCENLDLINASFESYFIQGILSGELPQEDYDDTELEQAYFCLSMANLWKKACRKKGCDDAVKELFNQFIEAYTAFGEDVLTVYGFAMSDLKPSVATRNYINYAKRVMKNYPVEYLAVLSAADVRIYVEMAQRLKDKGVFYLDSPHKQWVHEVLMMEPLVTAATEFVDGAQALYDSDTASAIYRQALERNIPTL